MEILYFLLPLALLLIGTILWAFFWAIRSGQFDDLEGPAYRAVIEKDAVVDEPVRRVGAIGRD